MNFKRKFSPLEIVVESDHEEKLLRDILSDYLKNKAETRFSLTNTRDDAYNFAKYIYERLCK